MVLGDRDWARRSAFGALGGNRAANQRWEGGAVAVGVSPGGGVPDAGGCGDESATEDCWVWQDAASCAAAGGRDKEDGTAALQPAATDGTAALQPQPQPQPQPPVPPRPGPGAPLAAKAAFIRAKYVDRVLLAAHSCGAAGATQGLFIAALAGNARCVFKGRRDNNSG